MVVRARQPVARPRLPDNLSTRVQFLLRGGEEISRSAGVGTEEAFVLLRQTRLGLGSGPADGENALLQARDRVAVLITPDSQMKVLRDKQQLKVCGKLKS